MACIGIEIKERREKGKENVPQGKEMGDAAMHNSPEKNHGPRKLKTDGRQVSQKK